MGNLEYVTDVNINDTIGVALHAGNKQNLKLRRR